MADFHTPTIQDIEEARKVFEEIDPRKLFYRAATELVELTISGKTSLTLAEAIAVLLQTWNRPFYRYRSFDSQHFSDIDGLIKRYRKVLESFRQRSIGTLHYQDGEAVKKVFKSFEEVLGPVGAAKSLHLLAPLFFPLWDRAIARAYGLPLHKRGENAERYFHFMEIAKEQHRCLGGETVIGQNILKSIDEYNFCKYTRNSI